ncbi:glycosyltransferase [Elioraea sp.]|uniref:glycosyltransferase n=1 Tax=Elioraea sp. TaxID=2185103 RepID=UPI003F70FCF7
MAGAHYGGAETFFVRLCAALGAAGEELLAVIRRDADRAAALRRAGLAPVELGFGGPLDLLTRPRLARALRRFAPRVAMAWMNRAARFTPAGPWLRVGRLGGYYDLRYYAGFDHLVGNTRGIVEWVARQGWPRERVHHLPNFAPDLSGAVPADRASLGVAPDAFLVLAMGRLHPSKGFDVLIEAAVHLPDMAVLIAGEGEQRAVLTELARRHGVGGRIRFLGWRDDQAALLAACDVFVCPSRHEPLGNVVLEAWSAARPVVAATSPGPCELIEPGTTGLLVPAEDPRALAEAIATLRDDGGRARAVAEAGRAAFLRDHAEAPVIARWRDFLTGVAR